jgi:hypothetical protein
MTFLFIGNSVQTAVGVMFGIYFFQDILSLSLDAKGVNANFAACIAAKLRAVLHKSDAQSLFFIGQHWSLCYQYEYTMGASYEPNTFLE